MNWQPIETAPKDGRHVLLFIPNHLTVVGNWDGDMYAKKPRPYWTNDRERLYGINYVRMNQPTHWMPLPAPPTDRPAAFEVLDGESGT